MNVCGIGVLDGKEEILKILISGNKTNFLASFVCWF